MVLNRSPINYHDKRTDERSALGWRWSLLTLEIAVKNGLLGAGRCHFIAELVLNLACITQTFTGSAMARKSMPAFLTVSIEYFKFMSISQRIV